MRDQIYYWKCDSPSSTDAKKRSYFKEKYDQAGLAEAVLAACRRLFGDAVLGADPLRVDGNHTAFRIRLPDRACFFRADDGSGDDDYMRAESALMARAAAQGLPVPKVLHTDVSRAFSPFRFQIMELCPDPPLDRHHKAGTLDQPGIARQLGRCLRQLHAISLEGFGFIDTDRLARDGTLRGLDTSYADYFFKRFEDHLGYLLQHGLMSAADAAEVRRQFARHRPRLDRPQGVLVHRDMALWNVLGTPTRVTAIIDWDDAVSGDPADDLGMLRCFYPDAFLEALMDGYGPPPDAGFDCRVWMHTLRNLLWKTKLRHALGYFEKDRAFFLNTPDVTGSLRAHTLALVQQALERVRSFAAP